MLRKTINIILILACVTSLFSCKKDLSPETKDTKTGDAVTIAVGMDNGNGTLIPTKGIGINRAEQLDAEDYVINGEFAAYVGSSTLMTSHQKHCVLFTDNDKTAHLYKVTDHTTGAYSLDSLLVWDKFRKADKTYEAIQFWMDNLPLTKSYYWGATSVPSGWSGTPVPFTEEEKGWFKAQYEAYDAAGNPIHTNDIISSASSTYQNFSPTKDSEKQKQVYSVSLRHKMARFSIELVEIPDNYEIQEITLTNLVQNIEAYRRWDGGVICNYSGDTDGRSDWTFDPTHIHKGDNPTGVSSEGKDLYSYTTDNVILPAHAFTYNNKEYWPVLKVKFIDKDDQNTPYEVKMVLPRSYYQNYTSTGAGTAAALTGFNQNRHLTIPARISKEIPDIIFMPVREVEWTDIGHYILNGSEPDGSQGIHNLDDLKFCIDYFNAAPLFPEEYKSRYQFTGNGGTVISYHDMRAYWNLLSIYCASYEVPAHNATPAHRSSLTLKFADDFATNVTQTEVDALVASHTMFKGSLSQDNYSHYVPDFTDPTYIMEYVYNSSVKLTFTGSDGQAYTDLDISGLKGPEGIYTYEDLERMIFEINYRGGTAKRAYNSYLWRFGTLQTTRSTVKSDGNTYYDVVYHVNLYADLPAPSVKIRIPESLYVVKSDLIPVDYYFLNSFTIDFHNNGHTIGGQTTLDDFIEQ